MTTITWTIAQLDCLPAVEGLSTVVFNIHWRVFVTEDEFTGSAYGVVAVELDPAAPFTPFEQLTEDQVLNWAKTSIGDEGVAGYERSAYEQIERTRNPPVVSPSLPWGIVA